MPNNTDTDSINTRLAEAERAQAIVAGLQPAFRHTRTGEAHLAQTEKGVPAADYAFNGLPDAWVIERDAQGTPVALHPDVVAGYWRDARFIALSQLSRMPLDS